MAQQLLSYNPKALQYIMGHSNITMTYLKPHPLNLKPLYYSTFIVNSGVYLLLGFPFGIKMLPFVRLNSGILLLYHIVQQKESISVVCENYFVFIYAKIARIIFLGFAFGKYYFVQSAKISKRNCVKDKNHTLSKSYGIRFRQMIHQEKSFFERKSSSVI